jgi:hypothetical protein
MVDIAAGLVFSGGVHVMEASVDAWAWVNGSMKAWAGRVIVVAVVAKDLVAKEWVHGYMSVVITMVVWWDGGFVNWEIGFGGAVRFVKGFVVFFKWVVGVVKGVVKGVVGVVKGVVGFVKGVVAFVKRRDVARALRWVIVLVRRVAKLLKYGWAVVVVSVSAVSL